MPAQAEDGHTLGVAVKVPSRGAHRDWRGTRPRNWGVLVQKGCVCVGGGKTARVQERWRQGWREEPLQGILFTPSSAALPGRVGERAVLGEGRALQSGGPGLHLPSQTQSGAGADRTFLVSGEETRKSDPGTSFPAACARSSKASPAPGLPGIPSLFSKSCPFR